MKRLFLLLFVFFIFKVNAQTTTNKFPSDGNVGIGTTDPQTDLHVQKNSISVVSTIESLQDGYSSLELKSNSKTWTWTKRPGGEGDGLKLFYNDGSLKEALNIMPTGYSGQNARINLMIGGNVILNSGNADGARLYWNGGSSGTQTYASRLAPDGSLGFYPNEGQPTTICLTQNGRVGVGTMNPTEKFQIGDRFTLSDGGWKGICSNIKWDYNLLTNVRIADGPASGMYYTEKGNTLFLNGSSKPAGSTLNDAYYTMILYNSGQVGVGTNYDLNGFPDQTVKFFVEGGIRARKVKVDQATWADFVFHKDYHLPTIESVDKYIQQYRHLPSVPSEKEVKESGIDVGEMNKLLLQKIEELTLYIIEQNKRTAQLENDKKSVEDRLELLQKDIAELKRLIIKK